MEVDILNDYEHSVTNKITEYGGNADFPQPEDYKVTKADVESYLFDKQAILDSLGSQKSQYTLAGVLIVLPVLVASIFPEDELPGGAAGGAVLALLAGILLALIVALVQRAVRKMRLRKLYESDIEDYIAAVLRYNEKI
jgi:hypothetical protein